MKRNLLAYTAVTLFLLASVFFVWVIYNQNNYISQLAQDISQIVVGESKLTQDSSYKVYSQEDFNNLVGKKVVGLYFFANWSEVSREQDLINSQIDLKSLDAALFKVHILDSQTSQDTTNISKKYSVEKESTLVILDKNGAVSYKSEGLFTLETIINEIKKAGDR